MACFGCPQENAVARSTRSSTDITGSVVVLPYDQAAARWHAREQARLSRSGKPPPFVDGQIAAIAAIHRLVLVTRNFHDFSSFARLEVESWFGVRSPTAPQE